MANEPLKPSKKGLKAVALAIVAEMFMANEPLKHVEVDRPADAIDELQRCLWRMSH